MKTTLAVGALTALLVFAAQAQGGANGSPPTAPPVDIAERALDWSGFARGFGEGSATARHAAAADQVAAPQLDVVDAHWMALTMWGEARGDGEAGMRAVGHVIDNRRKAGRHGPFATDTVSEAWQFSCWNPGDPNRAAMLNVEALPSHSRDHQLWRTARRVADEILSGQSEDPTGGALFYHAGEVRPAWASGITPIVRIGRHIFYRTAR